MNYCVEQVTFRDGLKVFNRQATKDINDSLNVAQEMAHVMWPEDPMTVRTFRNGGKMYYTNINDCGDTVIIGIKAYEKPLEDLPKIENVLPTYFGSSGIRLGGFEDDGEAA